MLCCNTLPSILDIVLKFLVVSFCVFHGTGSLGTSVFDTDVYLVGASGGVYALLAAHLANVLLVSQPAQSLSHRNNFVFLSISQWS